MDFRIKTQFGVAGLSAALVAALGAHAANTGFAPVAPPRATASLAGVPVNELIGADGRMHFFVELDGAASAVVYAAELDRQGSRSPSARAAATRAAKDQLRRVRAAQSVVAAALASPEVAAQEVYRVAKVANGFVVRAEPGKFGALAALQGVRTVRVVYPESTTNSTSVPFIDAPKAWGDLVGAGVELTGAGISIAVIDTGVDYQHTHFGGTGLIADYTANDRAVAPDAYFPTDKVVGGWDFAGDNYNAGGNGGTTGSTTPTADADPMDCNSHGTHVAGIAAGYGVNADGTTYAGPWDNTTPFGTMRIGPGVAPEAEIYALRVFGCRGSTTLTTQAIEWAVDPNNDDDFSDHLDVINMSLGSNFGSANDLTAISADNAALVGVVVVTSAGNAGDTHFITGSPGAGARALSVASSLDSGLAGAALQVNTPPGIAGTYAAAASAYTDPNAPPPPAPSGQTADLVLVDDGSTAGAGGTVSDACQTPFANAAAVAGKIALVDRGGGCAFTVKAQNAQANGAIGVIIANNVAGDPIPNVMGGAGAVDLTIPGISIARPTRDALVTQLGLGTVNVTLNAASAADTLSTFSSRGPRRASSPIKLKPEVTAPGQSITSAMTGVQWNGAACSPCVANLSGANATLVQSGTSMAAPHMAGVMALLHQQHPTWSVEELKALAMNYATHDLYLGANQSVSRFAPSRVGAGRVDVARAVAADVVAMSKDDPGLVSVTFGTEVVGNTNLVRTVRVVNHGTTDQTFDLALDVIRDAPGVNVSFPGGNSLVVPAGQTVEFAMNLSANANDMDNLKDPTMADGQAVAAPAGLAGLGALARHRMTEETGYITLSQSGDVVLRVPYYSEPRPASAMAGGTIMTGGASSGATTIPLTGTDFCTGTLGAGPSCTGTFPTDEVPLVSPFELQLSSPRNPARSIVDAQADIRHVGVAADATGTNIFFGISTWAPWSSPNEAVFNIWIDQNEDGVWDFVVFNGSVGQISSRVFGTTESAQDNFLSFRFTPPGTVTSQFFLNSSPATVDTDLHNSSVVVIPVAAAGIGLGVGNDNFRYRVESCPWFAPLCSALGGFVSGAGLDNTGPGFATWNRAARGLDFGGSFLFEDLAGDSVPVTFNIANMAANGSTGALLLHHHNAVGNQAQVVPVEGAATADLHLSKAVSNATPDLLSNVVLTLTVQNQGGTDATGVMVVDALPSGLTYVSDDGGGAYNNATGEWTIGNLANGASASLAITASVESSSALESPAWISDSSPLDPDLSDNQAVVSVNAGESANLSVTVVGSVANALVVAPISYTITASNAGPDTAFNVVVDELFVGREPLIPANSSASDGVYDSVTGTWTLASLAANSSATLTIDLPAPNMAGDLTLQADIASNQTDPDSADNTASDTIAIQSPAMITATKTVTGNNLVGGGVIYTVTLSNASAYDQQDNSGDEFVDVLPPELTLVSATASMGTAVATPMDNTVRWNGAVSAGGSVTMTITAMIDVGTELAVVSNQGQCNVDEDGNGSNEALELTDDPAVAGASDPTEFTVLSPAALSATKTVAGDQFVGGTVSYTVVLSNSSNAQQLDNAGDEFTDVLPAQLTLVSATASSGTAVATLGTNTVTWNGAVPGNASVTITINATVNAGTELQVISNQGSFLFDQNGDGGNETAGNTDDPALPGPTDPTSFIVGSPATVSATKVLSSTTEPVPGATIQYTIVISNAGPGGQLDNAGDEFVDVLPAGLALLSATASSGTVVADVPANTVRWNGAIAASGSVTLTIDAEVLPAAAGQTITNQGTVNFDGDGNGSNESSALTDDPALPGPADATSFLGSFIPDAPIPADRGFALVALLVLIIGGAFWQQRRV